MRRRQSTRSRWSCGSITRYCASARARVAAAILCRMAHYVVRVERGGPWDWSRGMREQAGWDEHARFMDGLVESGFVLLVGPLEGEREVLWVVEAESEAAVRERMAEDPWASNGMLRPVRIERWTIVLDSPLLEGVASRRA